jgi:hypothetical protein
MDKAGEIRDLMSDEWLPAIYRLKVRTQRTRSFTLEIPERENSAEIQYTLLGIELKVGKRRFACPDLAAARYLRVFARLGVREFAVPYDITKISSIADELETSWQRLLILLSERARGRSSRSAAQMRSKAIHDIRHEVITIGPGDAMPAFDRPTTQRR